MIARLRSGVFPFVPATLLVCLALLTSSLAGQEQATASGGQTVFSDPGRVRFATFNCSLNRNEAGQLIRDLKGGACEQARKVAAIIREVRPDVLLLCEFDYDEGGEALRLFREGYLENEQTALEPVHYAWSFIAPVNTGIASGHDLNQDGEVSLPDDGFGFGKHPGQYGMAVLSRCEIDAAGARTFQKLLWRDMPDARLPKAPDSSEAWYPKEAVAELRLSSKSHWDVPVRVGERTIHLLASHPTPPVFDGREDRNGLRNHDEIRFWAEYVGGAGDWCQDDKGRKGGLVTDAAFVIAGDLNADPVDGESTDCPARLLTENALVQDPMPTSDGGLQQSVAQGQANINHKADARYDTGDFGDATVGNLRVDYVLPSASLEVIGSGVFWPDEGKRGFDWVDCSDHRLVWVDLKTER
jgi:endonuclease/exonuclease/phosphatase family metal-dependent hydrolase